MRIVAGVDCHKSSHTAVFLDAVGQVLVRITFPTTEEGYERALGIGRQLGCADRASKEPAATGTPSVCTRGPKARGSWRFPVS